MWRVHSASVRNRIAVVTSTMSVIARPPPRYPGVVVRFAPIFCACAEQRGVARPPRARHEVQEGRVPHRLVRSTVHTYARADRAVRGRQQPPFVLADAHSPCTHTSRAVCGLNSAQNSEGVILAVPPHLRVDASLSVFVRYRHIPGAISYSTLTVS